VFLKKSALTVAAILLCMGMLGTARADELSQAGARLVEKYGQAVVSLQIVTKTTVSYGGKDASKEESKSETTGLVIDPSGLVVTALSSTDPNDILRSFMPDKMQMSTQVTSVKIILSNGQEMPAQVVLRDKDLDLVFLKPKKKPSKPLVATDLSNAAKPALLDETITLYRLGTVASRSIAACADRIQGIVEKPRMFYLPGAQTANTDGGAAIFDKDSKIVGILVLRVAPGRASSNSGFMSGMKESMIPIVIPASDILDAARQALEK
jgi:S1-C subfamily serine protease